MREKKPRIKYNCIICNKVFEVIITKKNVRFCSNSCKYEFFKTPAGKKERSEWTKKQWEGNLDRKKELSKKIKESYIKNPERKEVSKNNLSEYNKIHNGNGNGRQHTLEHKQYMSVKIKGLKRTKKTKDLIKKNHWSKSEQREGVIDKIKAKVISPLTRQKMSETKSRLIAEGKIEMRNCGKTGYYISEKTKQREYFHSSYELYRMNQLDSDETVIFWTKKHKIIIPYEYLGDKKRYIPDFYILKQNIKILEEVKSSWTTLGEKNKEKKLAAQNYCDKEGLVFVWNILNLTYYERKEL